ncbi:MAG: MFS transporter [Rhodocyclaceae bacterium]|nr:MFS transporter [Rhodocyclaceae bacterium]MDO9602440.1 MFS transporter [Rhodocyclaceae bacterium]MDP2196025.1 MFS transporter [Rhodocyclaceae bacterium]
MPVSPLGRLGVWYFFYFAFVGAFAPYFTLYLQDVGLSAWEIGVLMSVPQVMRLVAPNLWGLLADHLGHRVGIVRLAALFSALGFVGFFFTHNYTGMLLAMALVWFFWSAALPLVEAMTLDYLVEHPDRYGRIRLWGSVGFIVSVMVIGTLLDYLPIAALLWAILAILASVLASALTLPDTKVGAGGTAPPLSGLLKRPEVLALLAACFFMAVAHGPLYVFYSIHLVDHGYGKMAVGLFWSLGVLAEIGVFMAMPRLMRHVSLRQILLVSFALAILRFLLIGWGADSPVLLVVAQLLHGVTFGAYHAAAMAVLTRWFDSRQQARVQGIYGSLSFGAGGMVGGLIGGAAWGSLGAGITYTFAALCAVCGWWLVWRSPATAWPVR